jgi:hypothetical protein
MTVISAVTVSNPPCMRALFWNKFNNSCDTDRLFQSQRLSACHPHHFFGVLWGRFSSTVDVNSLTKLTTPDASRSSAAFSNLFLLSHLTLSKEKCTELNHILPTATRQDPVQGRQSLTQTEARKLKHSYPILKRERRRQPSCASSSWPARPRETMARRRWKAAREPPSWAPKSMRSARKPPSSLLASL